MNDWPRAVGLLALRWFLGLAFVFVVCFVSSFTLKIYWPAAKPYLQWVEGAWQFFGIGFVSGRLVSLGSYRWVFLLSMFGLALIWDADPLGMPWALYGPNNYPPAEYSAIFRLVASCLVLGLMMGLHVGWLSAKKRPAHFAPLVRCAVLRVHLAGQQVFRRSDFTSRGL